MVLYVSFLKRSSLAHRISPLLSSTFSQEFRFKDYANENIAACMAGNNAIFNFSYRDSGNNGTFSFSYNEGLRLKICYEKGTTHLFSDNKAGKVWFYGFMRRKNNILIRKAENFSYCRLMRFNKEIVNAYFELLGNTLETVNLHNQPHLIYDVDESEMQLTNNRSQEVLAEKWTISEGKIQEDHYGNYSSEICLVKPRHKQLPIKMQCLDLELQEYSNSIHKYFQKLLLLQVMSQIAHHYKLGLKVLRQLLAFWRQPQYQQHLQAVNHLIPAYKIILNTQKTRHSLNVKATLVTHQLFSKGVQGDADQPSTSPVHKRGVKIRKNNDDIHSGDCGRNYYKSMNVPWIQCVACKVWYNEICGKENILKCGLCTSRDDGCALLSESSSSDYNVLTPN
ncbi:hypothetical protein PR048_013079 [Dryococelus australis]|uniref:Uncharacterized protein n=1 Tax=Dryococelus australis TaxID=614101 RepID=A0ABQ9HRL6_9NEOP|nr:hypothetical protein PR048_013079 [Dryococelus australis]